MAENVDILGEVFMTDEFVGKYVKFSEEYQQLSDKETEIYNKMRTVLTGEELELFEKSDSSSTSSYSASILRLTA